MDFFQFRRRDDQQHGPGKQHRERQRNDSGSLGWRERIGNSDRYADANDFRNDFAGERQRTGGRDATIHRDSDE